jgi:predicted transposase YdaD
VSGAKNLRGLVDALAAESDLLHQDFEQQSKAEKSRRLERMRDIVSDLQAIRDHGAALQASRLLTGYHGKWLRARRAA